LVTDPNYHKNQDIQSLGNQTVRFIADGDSCMGFVDGIDPQRIALVFAKYHCLKFSLLLMMINTAEFCQSYSSYIKLT
jgi:hypothetical protein